ncbi:pyridoxal-phosphate dependent enzyme [Streptacidiphilus sp. PB12-B1b]|uniref:1-aminocyclopropane-1-carboxylate deaminase/D-cysteine desulfhydrase n=1 Tax=Streptacidiphilus sp. PB12-B1b TaxID=2705012 RepID=UPI0015FA1F20|nr:pyridoxal-phosphate dependent enzyme [Streptacidiphilus sp. PB12-B1b]QMU75395.1 pyridoxal-phosphate dependent enzyme [Streptacidiphilus sp. PB12-B1b]
MSLSPGAARGSPLQELADERLRRAGVRLLLKRDDLLHPTVPGNKWRKLLPNLAEARACGHTAVLTFGGAYSNHLRATAAAGRAAALRTVGVVRGDELRDRPLNPSLAQAAAWGMELDFLDRASWRERQSEAVLGRLLERHGPALVVPEGGSNPAGVRGCVPLGRELAASGASVVCCSVGTGGTLAGLAAGLAEGQQALGYASLKHAPLAAETAALQRDAFGRTTSNWRIEDGWHLGGYGRTTPELTAFADDFRSRHGVSLDLGYEAKAMFGLMAGLGSGPFAAGTTVAFLIAG